jgi:hypothetical protein
MGCSNGSKHYGDWLKGSVTVFSVRITCSLFGRKMSSLDYASMVLLNESLHFSMFDQ